MWSFIKSLPVLLILFAGVSCKKECECPKTETKTVTFQPGSSDGQDCLVAMRQSDNNLYASSNHNATTDFTAICWSYNEVGAGNGINRSYLKFAGVSDIPEDAEIKSAKLSLFGVTSGIAAPLGNSFYPGSPYGAAGNNKCWLKKVTSDWDESTITWNNKPGTSDGNQVEIAASTDQWNYNVTDLDVTALIKEMVADNENFGFCLQLQDETIYKSILFGTSENSDPLRRPKLIVEYEVTK